MPRKGSGTKTQMVNALWELLGEYPLDKITVTLITKRCHLNRQTFYYHFNDIHDFYVYAYRSVLAQIFRAIAPLEDLQPICDEVCRLLDGKSRYFIAVTGSAEYSSLRHNLLEYTTTFLARRYKDEPRLKDYTETDRGFLMRMYALVYFEFAEKYYLGQSYSSLEGFTHAIQIFFGRYFKECSVEP